MAAAGPLGLGPLEIGIIVLVIVLIFGVGKVADLGGALGKSVREFRREAGAKDDEGEKTEAAPSESAPAAATFCGNCGSEVVGGAKFCEKCGTPVTAAVN